MHLGHRSGGPAHRPETVSSRAALSAKRHHVHLLTSGLLALAMTLSGVALASTLSGVALAQPTEPAPVESTPATEAPTPGAAPASPTPPAAAPAGAVGGEHYDMKLRELEEKVVTLKEKIFRSKTRLMLLKERVLNDVIAEAKAVVVHVNEMGNSFKLESVLYHLDGEKIYFQDATSGVLDKEKFEIFANNVLPGNHVLSVEMIYKGDSTVFAYLKDYTFKLRTNYTFYATKGKVTTVQAVGYQKGDITWDLTKRPSITFRVAQASYTKDQVDGQVEGQEQPAGDGK